MKMGVTKTPLKYHKYELTEKTGVEKELTTPAVYENRI